MNEGIKFLHTCSGHCGGGIARDEAKTNAKTLKTISVRDIVRNQMKY